MEEACQRCGRPGRGAESANPDARPLRKAQHGYCANCALTDFIKGIDVLMFGIEKNGVSILLNPLVQQQFAELFEAGQSEANFSEINWQMVVDNWDLPFPKRFRHKQSVNRTIIRTRGFSEL